MIGVYVDHYATLWTLNLQAQEDTIKQHAVCTWKIMENLSGQASHEAFCATILYAVNILLYQTPILR